MENNAKENRHTLYQDNFHLQTNLSMDVGGSKKKIFFI